jgi:hypothetical protein
LLDSIWEWFNHAGPLANAASIIVPCVTLAATARWYIHRYIHARLRDKDGEISDLKADIAHRQESLDTLRSTLQTSKVRYDQLEARLAETALATAEKELRDNNFTLADAALERWLETEGKSVSELLFHRAEWAAAHAAGDLRAPGLAAAEAYAIAAVALWRENHAAVDLLGDVAVLKAGEAQPSPSVGVALAQLEEGAVELFKPDLVELANISEAEAHRRWFLGQYHAALPAVERSLGLRNWTVGRTAVQTIGTQRLKADILNCLGRNDEALVVAKNALDACEANPNLGENHL